ncbi:MAG: hypothetical protein A4E72_01843 [Syntrophus sp. PtaU1.Bin208]|nr:MAG: hypothetical protein A4E72_01843 [Syntrophus sp. PtaU1.Bin208]
MLFLNFLKNCLGDPASFLEKKFARVQVSDIVIKFMTDQRFLNGHVKGISLTKDMFHIIEVIQQILRGVAHCL